MDCRDCSLYNADTETCRSQKLNPRSKEDATQVAQMLGVRVICVFNEFREPIIQRMYDKEIRGGLLGYHFEPRNRKRF
jgi:hypothetical protein